MTKTKLGELVLFARNIPELASLGAALDSNHIRAFLIGKKVNPQPTPTHHTAQP